MINPFEMHLGIVVLGLLLGSFATACVYRIPREIPLGLFKKVRSTCPHCSATIPWYRNLPILSFLLQKGRTACCNKKISPRYVILEILTPVLFLLTYEATLRRSDLSFVDVYDYLELGKNLYFTWSLIVVTFIDLEFRIIPDRFSIGNWAVALLASLIGLEPSLIASIAGSLFGFGSFFALAWTYEKIKKIEGLGFGDVKMMGWLGAWVGLFGVPFVILVASVSGLIVGLVAMRFSGSGMQTAIPFGPFLALGAYLAWILQALGIW